jgi:pyruvate dehydrogenase E2 component (dihydrolipoamide acetyltransferase)
MPEVADDPTVATLTAWLVSESGDFAGAQSIATVETDTSLVSIEVAEPGILIKSLVEPGTRVEPGSPLAVLGAPGEVVEDVERLMVELGLAVAPESSDAHVHLRAVSAADELYATTWPLHEPAHPDQSPVDDGASPPDAEATAGEPDEPAADPDASTVELVEDPDAGAEKVAEPAPAEELVAAASTDPLADASDDLVVRRVVNWADTVAAAVVDTLRVSAPQATKGAPVSRARQVQVRETVRADRLSAVFTEVESVSLIALVVKAVAVTSRRLPLRSDVASPGDVALLRWADEGPLAPVIRVANLMTVSSLTTTLADIDARVREGRLASAELEPAAVTVVDLGAEGAAHAMLEATDDHPAVLTVGALREQPVVEHGKVVPGTVMEIGLSCDASRIGGVVAARWLAQLTVLLEQPLLFLT